MTALEPPADEVAQLRHCLNDLVTIAALPAQWEGVGAEPQEVVGTLLDTLREMLRLAFVYARLGGAGGEDVLEMARVDAPLDETTTAREIGALLDDRLGAEAGEWPGTARLSVGETELHVACIRLGPRGEIGVVVAGARRPDFPVQHERLLLDVAASQAAVALQQAHRLRERERESRLIVDNIPGLVALLAATGDVEVVNRQLLEYFGQTLEELRHWGTNDTVHPEDLPHVIEVFGGAIAAGTPYTIVQRFKRWDGVYRWFENSGFPLRDAGGGVARWCVLLTDIDERKRAEDALRRSESDLQLIIDTIPALAWSTRTDGIADFFNRHYLDFIGLTAEQASGWGWTVAVHPDDLPGLAATWQRCLTSGAPGEAEARLRRHDGVFRWFLFRANPLRDEAGAIVKWYGVNTDIEDRKQAEDALRRSEAFLLEVQHLSHTGGWRYDVATDIVESSPEIQRFYDPQPHEDISRPPFWFDRIHPEDRPRVQAEFERCMREKTTYRAAYRTVLPDGSLRFQHATGHPVTNDAGELVEFIGASMDMTEYWQASNDLDRASEALRELQTAMARAAQVATVSELAASIAHEVNQPLSGIVMNASTCVRMLDASPPNVDGARETARRINRDGHRASEVITRLRALFGRREFTPEPIDLNDATREVVALSLSDLQRNRVQLQAELADDLPSVTGDRVQLQQVILNLLRNASDAMADVHDRARRLLVKTEREAGDRVRVTVRDSGVGVDGESMNRLFDAFYTTKRDGMGIGLSVSRSIVERHQGRLWAEPNDGPGATFAFSIPRRAE
jgi:PAS domain S-box-containing protein